MDRPEKPLGFGESCDLIDAWLSQAGGLGPMSGRALGSFDPASADGMPMEGSFYQALRLRCSHGGSAPEAIAGRIEGLLASGRISGLGQVNLSKGTTLAKWAGEHGLAGVLAAAAAKDARSLEACGADGLSPVSAALLGGHHACARAALEAVGPELGARLACEAQRAMLARGQSERARVAAGWAAELESRAIGAAASPGAGHGDAAKRL